MGLKALDQSFARMILNLYRISISALEKDMFKFVPEKIVGSSYHKVWQTKEPLIIEDLSKLKRPTQVEQLPASKKEYAVCCCLLLSTRTHASTKL
jgi:hypothetical protein